MKLKSIENEYRYLRKFVFVRKLNILVDFVEVPFVILSNFKYTSCGSDNGLCAFKDECNRNDYFPGLLPCKLEDFKELGYFNLSQEELINLDENRHYRNLLIFVKSDMSLFTSAYLFSKYEDTRV